MFEASDYLVGLNSALINNHDRLFDGNWVSSDGSWLSPKNYCCHPEVILKLPHNIRNVYRLTVNGCRGQEVKFTTEPAIVTLCGGLPVSTTGMGYIYCKSTMSDAKFDIPFILADDINDPKFARLIDLWAMYRNHPQAETRILIVEEICKGIWPTEKVLVFSSIYMGWLKAYHKHIPYHLV